MPEDVSTEDLHIEISVVIEQEGVNQRWNYDIDVPVPPAYTTDMEMKAFLRHELDRAMSDFQEQEFEYSRSAEIIRQFGLRLNVIERLMQFAPREQSRDSLVAVIRAIIDMDSEDLLLRYAATDDHPEA